MPASLHTHGLWSLSDTECSYDCVLGSGHQLTMGVWKVWDRAPCVFREVLVLCAPLHACSYACPGGTAEVSLPLSHFVFLHNFKK